MIKLKMKFAVVLLLVLFSNNMTFSQEEEVVEEEVEIKDDVNMLLNSIIEMDIDKSIFPVTQGSSHFTEDQKAGIVAMLMPSSFEKLEENLKKEKSREGLETLDKGELNIDGKRILFLKQSMEREGETYYMIMYAKEESADASIMVTAFYEPSKDEEYKDYVEKAIKSAKLVSKE